MELEPTETNYQKPCIEEDVYNAEFKGAKKVKDGEYGPRVAIIFDVYHKEDENPVELAYVCYRVLTEKSNLGKAFTALGAKIDQKFKTEDYYGRFCKVFVENYTKDGIEASGINKIMKPDENTGKFIEEAKQKAKAAETTSESKPEEKAPAEPAPAATTTPTETSAN